MPVLAASTGILLLNSKLFHKWLERGVINHGGGFARASSKNIIP
jgi:hypothetical protein